MSIYRSFPLMIALALGLVACQGHPPPEEIIRPIRAVQVSDANELARRSLPGRAKAKQEVNLSFRVAGPLIAFTAKVGDEVKAGDLLARIDPRDFEVRRSSMAAQLDRAEASLKFDQGEFDRVLRIRDEDPGAVSQTMIERRRQLRDAAEASVASLRSTVQSTADAVDDTYLRAPFDGTVVATYVENHEDVLPKRPHFGVV